MTKASKIPFVLVPFPDPKMKEAAIAARLTRHYLKLRSQSPGRASVLQTGDADSSSEADSHDVSWGVDRRIRARASRIAAHHARKSRLVHLSKEDMERLEPLRHGATLAGISTADEADELGAALQAEFPWMRVANTIVWHAMRRSVALSHIGFRVDPLLLDGPPGIGKSRWSRYLANLLGVESTLIDATGEQASFAISGLQKGWSGSLIGRPLDLILRTGGANPMFVIDEIDKAGAASSSQGRSFGLAEALLPFLERSSAGNWNCPAMRLPFDMSWINWVLTSNDMSGLPESLLSRCQVVRLQNLTLAELQAFANREGRRRGLQEMSIDAVKLALEFAFKRGWVPNLRTVMRLLDHAEVLEARPSEH